MPRTTTNSTRTVVTEGTGDRAVSLPPDVCNVPGAGPAPFQNFALSADLQGGTSTVLVAQKPVFTTAGRLEPSLPAHAGVKKGVGSGAYQGAVTPASYSRDLHAEGHPVVRTRDDTKHNRANTTGKILPAAKDGTLDGMPSQAQCRALWAKYEAEARAKIAPAGADHKRRNRIITGAYAQLFKESLAHPELTGGVYTWAGLAQYGSKTVGCGLQFAEDTIAAAPGRGRKAGEVAEGPLGLTPVGGLAPLAPMAGEKVAGPVADATAGYSFEMFGKANRDLFLDIYPAYRFYHDHGWNVFRACAWCRAEQPMTSHVYNGFEALSRGDGYNHLMEIAWQEQQNVLQKILFNDKRIEALMIYNDAHVPFTHLAAPFTNPAELTLSTYCHDASRPSTQFADYHGNRDVADLADLGQRMDWVVRGAAPMYLQHLGSSNHQTDADYFIGDEDRVVAGLPPLPNPPQGGGHP